MYWYAVGASVCIRSFNSTNAVLKYSQGVEFEAHMTIQRPAVQCALQFSLLTFVTLDRVNNQASDSANASGNH